MDLRKGLNVYGLLHGKVAAEHRIDISDRGEVYGSLRHSVKVLFLRARKVVWSSRMGTFELCLAVAETLEAFIGLASVGRPQIDLESLSALRNLTAEIAASRPARRATSS